MNELQNWQSGGNIQFTGAQSGNAAADFLLGKFNSYRQVTGLTSRVRQNLPALFVHDDFRVSRRLTLNVGIRWEPYNGYVSEDGQMMLFAPGPQSTAFPKAPAGLLFPGDPGAGERRRQPLEQHRAPRSASPGTFSAMARLPSGLAAASFSCR